MKKKLIRRIISGALTLVLLGCTGCAQKQVYKQAEQKESKKPAALEAQPEVQDPGEAVQYTVSGCFSSDMVLQRDQIIKVWGWSENKGAVIYGELMGEKRYGIVDDNGAWLIEFSPKEYTTEGQTLTIYPKNGEKTEFKDVLIGDVWFVSGQSNAEFYFESTTVIFPKLKNDINEADNIRLYREDKADALDENGGLAITGLQKDVINKDYKWQKTTKDTVMNFSSVGYLFVKELSKETDVPQGIIMAAAGGCMLQDLMPEEALEGFEILDSSWQVGGLYNYLIEPFAKMAVKGMVFYQGESDTGVYKVYKEKLKAFVSAMRERFGEDFAFYNIQLSSHAMMADAWPDLPGLKAAQTDAYYEIPNSYLICSMDVGWQRRSPEEDPAHPYDKWTLAKRLAQTALCQEYGSDKYDIEYVSSPIPSEIKWKSGSVIIKFKNVGDGLMSNISNVAGFRIHNADGFAFVAEAKITGKDTVEVTIDQDNITAVSYGYSISALPEEAGLTNSEDVPALAFLMNKDQ